MTLESVDVVWACPKCGRLEDSEVIKYGDKRFCAKCIGFHFERNGVPSLSMRRIDKGKDEIVYKQSCQFCGAPRPVDESACSKCGKQPEEVIGDE